MENGFYRSGMGWQVTKWGYVVDELQEMMKVSLDQIYISHASHRDLFPLVRPIYDVQAPVRIENEQRVNIKLLFNNGLGPHQIVTKLQAQFHEDAYSLPAVHLWIRKVRRGREDLLDEPRPGKRWEEHITTGFNSSGTRWLASSCHRR
jgi:hypothetical protein